jgi:thiol-disulfide isomerase/thioredoxin/YHS domain-containing protein
MHADRDGVAEMFKCWPAIQFLRTSLAFALVLPIIVALTGHALSVEREILWTEDYEAAVQRCATSNTILLLHFYTDNCPPCKLLDKKTFHDSNLVAAMNEHVVPVRINADRRKDLVQRYNVNRWPTDIYFFPNGDEIYRGVSDQDPAVYTQKIKRLALRNRDWTLERQSLVKAQQRRQDQSIAAHTPQIQAERPVYAGNAGHPIKTQSAGWSSLQDSPSNVAASGVGKRVIENPYVTQQPLMVPAVPSNTNLPNPNMSQMPIASAPMVAAPIVSAPIASAPAASVPIVTPQLVTPPTTPPNNIPSLPLATIAANPVSTQRSLLATTSNPPTMPGHPQPMMAKPQSYATHFQPTLAKPNVPSNVSPKVASNIATNPSSTPSDADAPNPSAAKTPEPARKVYAETIGLGGYCPVALIESVTQPNGPGWVKGSASFAVRHRGRVYYCASEKARQTLLSNPDQYTPCLSGFDLVHFCKTGTLIDGKCEFGRVQSQTDRVFLFDNAENCQEFERDSEYYSHLLDKVATERVANGSNETQIR